MDERREIAKRVMRALRHESARRPLLNDQIIICLGTDTVAYANEQVAAVGGAATVVVPYRGGLMPLGWNIGPDEGLEMPSPGLVHPDSEVSMVVELMESTGSSAMSIRIHEGEAAVTEGEPLSVLV